MLRIAKQADAGKSGEGAPGVVAATTNNETSGNRNPNAADNAENEENEENAENEPGVRPLAIFANK
jgi:hypothetical protein